LIDIREVIDGSALRILIINTHLVVKDGVKADVFEVGDFLDASQIGSIAFTKA